MNKLDNRFIVTPNQFKNRIINGDFQIWQRGETFSFESDSSSNTYVFGYTADRFQCGNSKAGGKFTVSRGNINGFNSFKITVDTPPDNLSWDGSNERYWKIIQYLFEGNQLFDLVQKKSDITISFLFKSNVAGKFSVVFRNNRASDGSYSWGSDVWATSFEYDGSEVPKRFSFTIPLNNKWNGGIFNDNQLGFSLHLCCITDSHLVATTENEWISGNFISSPDHTNWASQAGNYIEITQLQLEEGSEATDFEYVPYEIQLLRCMRYYEKIECWKSITIGGEENNRWQTQVFSFKVRKRTTPSVSPLTVTFDTRNSKFTFDTVGATTDGVSFFTDSGGPDNSSKPVDIIEGPIIIEADAEL